MSNKSTEDLYAKDGDHPYLKVIKDLMQYLEDAYIKKGGKQYGDHKDLLTLNDLLYDASEEFDDKRQTYRYTGKPKSIKARLSARQVAREKQMSVIQQVEYYFPRDKSHNKDKKLISKESTPSIHPPKVQKYNIYIDEFEKNYRAGAHILDIYSDFGDDLSICIKDSLSSYNQISDLLRVVMSDEEVPYKSYSNRIYNYVNSLDDVKKEVFLKRLTQLGKDYKNLFVEQLKGANRFDRKLLPNAEDFSIFHESTGLENKDIKKIEPLSSLRYEYEKNPSFKKQLENNKVENWSPNILATILLCYVEFLWVRSFLTDIVKTEVEKNLKLRYFYRKFEHPDLQLDDRGNTIEEFSKLLTDYAINHDLETLFKFKDGQLLKKHIERLPQADFNKHDLMWEQIDQFLTVGLRIQLFEKLAYHTRFEFNSSDINGELKEYWPNK